MSHFPEGGLDSTRGKRSLAEVNVADLDGLFNTVSNYAGSGYNTGDSIMADGDTAVLADGSYKCSEGPCAHSSSMLTTDDLNGEVKCVEDNASCVLDGENARQLMYVRGTGSGTLILRALTFDKGYAGFGGGVRINSGAIVDLKLCIFTNNRATSSDYGGGAVNVYNDGTTVNVYGTRFNGNTADSGNGHDIYTLSGTITIHNTCPSPYSSNTPIQGSALDIEGIVVGDLYSYSGCVPTSAPTSAPTDSPTSAPTDSPTSAPTDSPTDAPTSAPTTSPPTTAPTSAPTTAPTSAPTTAPTSAPTTAPTSAPTTAPTTAPTMLPTLSPTVTPASGSGLGTAEIGGLVGGVLVFFAVCFCVYKMCFNSSVKP
ncbi:hypothetical protein TrCOL_g8316 [Triparma columacea]|uniref:Uncharacterized protein n=1 Tax=Triparma columacea TaxID=722753 RepID=A0A9W7GE98_9STRA|nr:hypothetical protein TrCOL_g8316 [Triparma columacea]